MGGSDNATSQQDQILVSSQNLSSKSIMANPNPTNMKLSGSSDTSHDDTTGSSDKTPSSPISSSPTQASSVQLQAPVSSQDRTLSELIGSPFAPFDHQAAVVGPFAEETNRELLFEQGPLNAFLHYLLRQCLGRIYASLYRTRATKLMDPTYTLSDAFFCTVELSTMLLDVILETHAWSVARPKHESQIAVLRLEKRISDVMATEKEQGMSSSNTLPFLSFLPSIIGRDTFASFMH